MKREYYIDGKQAKKRTFFKCLENNAYKYWYNEPHDSWACFEDYYGYVKQKNKKRKRIQLWTYFLERSNKMKLLKYALWFIAETVIILLFLALWWR